MSARPKKKVQLPPEAVVHREDRGSRKPSSSNRQLDPKKDTPLERKKSIIGGEITIASDKPRGWVRIRKAVPKIVNYGREQGILPPLSEKQAKGTEEHAKQEAKEEEQRHKEKRDKLDRVQIPTNDISTIHEAIPFLPVPPAILCFLLNFIAPGTGTIFSGIFALCMGQPRIQMKEGRKTATLLINCAVGVAQFMTITFLFVGWFWSIAWGGLLFIHSLQYREALLEKRKEAVATAAIEALTKDSILHRRDVKTLVKGQKGEKEQKKKGIMGK